MSSILPTLQIIVRCLTRLVCNSLTLRDSQFFSLPIQLYTIAEIGLKKIINFHSCASLFRLICRVLDLQEECVTVRCQKSALLLLEVLLTYTTSLLFFFPCLLYVLITECIGYIQFCPITVFGINMEEISSILKSIVQRKGNITITLVVL